MADTLTLIEWTAHLKKIGDAIAPLFPTIAIVVESNDTLVFKTNYCVATISLHLGPREGKQRILLPMERIAMPSMNGSLEEAQAISATCATVQGAVRCALDYCAGIRVGVSRD